MRYLVIAIVAIVLPAVANANPEDLAKARDRLLHGNYAEARSIYSPLLKNEQFQATAAIGMSRCWRAEGEYDKALDVLGDVLQKQPRQADILAEMADILYFRGEWEKAVQHATKALDQQKEHFLARWVLARIYRDRGDFEKAREELVWFVRTYNKRSNEDREITDPEELLLVGLATVERARWLPQLSDQFQFVLTEVWGHAAKLHKNFWWAEYHRGKLFQEKYSEGSAQRSFNKVLEINPRAAEVFAAKALSSLQRYDMKDAENFLDQALKINPHLPEALRLKADYFLTAGDVPKALEFLEKARKINPRSEQTLARIAACRFLNNETDAFNAIVKEVEKYTSKPGIFYSELGERLDERKRYDVAEEFYKKSITLRPKLVGARNQLGLLYMRLAREEEAQKILNAAFDDDPFNVRVYNTLKVLRHLKDYATLKTKHFIIRYDPDHDGTLARVMAKYLEEIYEELAEAFNYRPKEAVLIEIFNKHEMFSGRVTALPDLHTIGACTGRMVAMVSTHDSSKVITKPFNWNRVMRHELVHIFNLEQTQFQVPHWFTEGLAVRAEQTPMPPLWKTLLLKRVASGELLNLDNIHLGFIRPGSSEEWNLAYLQSKLYVDYLTSAYGQDAVGKLLDAYAKGKSTANAINAVCNLSKDDFEKGYRKFLENLVKDIAGELPKKRATFEELKAQVDKNPDDIDAVAALAERYYFLGNRDTARELADKALAANPAHPMACYVRANLLIAGGDKGAAIDLLNKAISQKDTPVEVFKLLGKLYFEDKKFGQAAEIYEQGMKVQPYDNYWQTQLARCYRQTGDQKKLIAALKALAPTDADDLEVRQSLAKLLSEAGQHEEAAEYARQALEIDVLDVESQTILLQSLEALNKAKEREEWQKLLTGS